MQAFHAILLPTSVCVLCISVTLTLFLGGEAGTGNDSAVTWEDRKTQKACLERYRVASAEIIAVFHEVAPEGIVEKASIDEAYIDVTSIVDTHLQVSHVAQSRSLAACNMAYLANNNNNNAFQPGLGVCGASLSSPGSLLYSAGPGNARNCLIMCIVT